MNSSKRSRIVAHLRATWSEERLAQLRSVLAARAAERRTQIDDRSLLAAGLPCVFLDEENSCTIHLARPLTCRGITSSSATSARGGRASITANFPKRTA